MGKVITFSAPSGAGKSTIIKHLLGIHPEFEFSVSATSRSPRGEERNGVEYYFLSAGEFRAKIAEGAFVEYEEVYRDHFYGTLKSEVERIWAKGNVILFDVDVKGGFNLKKYFGDSALCVLILPPSVEVLEERLRGRGTDSEDAIRERVAKAREEMEYGRGRFDAEIVNDRLQDTFAAVDALVADFLSK